MPLPAIQRARVGVSEVTLYPWNGADGPYDATTACPLFGLGELGVTTAVSVAQVKDGRTTQLVGAVETAREGRVSVASAVSDLRALSLLLGDEPVIVPATGGRGEVQYWAKGQAGLAPCFRLLARSTNGDGADRLLWPKLHVEGRVGFNLSRDRVTDLTFEAVALFDGTYARLDGVAGGASFDQLFESDPGTGAPADVVFVVDRSGSMYEPFGAGTRMTAAINAITGSLPQIAAVPGSRVAIVSFGAVPGGGVESPLTTDLAAAAVAAQAMVPGALGTPVGQGVTAARALLEARAGEGATNCPVLILLSDGEASDGSAGPTAVASMLAAHPDWRLFAVSVTDPGGAGIATMEQIGALGDGHFIISDIRSFRLLLSVLVLGG